MAVRTPIVPLTHEVTPSGLRPGFSMEKCRSEHHDESRCVTPTTLGDWEARQERRETPKQGSTVEGQTGERAS